jgi:hypothetical protein
VRETNRIVLNMMTIPCEKDSCPARVHVVQAWNAGERLPEGQIERGGRHSPSGL